MKKTIAIVLPFLAFVAIGCGDDTMSTPPDGSPPDGRLPDTMPMADALPMAPMLGAQIDRMGRPGINTALTDPLWDSSAANQAANLAAHEAAQDTYNQASDPAMWGTVMFGTDSALQRFRKILAIFDGLDGTCGNQPGFNGAQAGTAAYALGALVVDDELYLDTSHGTCAEFLGVELNALGIMANTDCGGRAPSYNTIDVIYNAAAGTAPGTVSNGITANTGNAATDMMFPWLGMPN